MNLRKLIKIAGNPNTHPDILTRIYNESMSGKFNIERDRILKVLCINPNTDTRILERLWWDYSKLVESNCVIHLLLLENPNFLEEWKIEAAFAGISVH